MHLGSYVAEPSPYYFTAAGWALSYSRSMEHCGFRVAVAQPVKRALWRKNPTGSQLLSHPA